MMNLYKSCGKIIVVFYIVLESLKIKEYAVYKYVQGVLGLYFNTPCSG